MSSLPWFFGSAQAAELAAKLGTFPFTTCEAIEQLRAIPASGCIPGAAVLVRFHTQSGDTGGGIYIYDPASAADDNDGSVIDSNSSGKWRIFESIVNPSSVHADWWGLRSSPGFDNSAKINAAVQALPLYSTPGSLVCPSGQEMKRGELHLPAGTFYISDTLYFTGGMQVRGHGQNATAIRLNTGASGYQDINTEKWMMVFEKSASISNNNIFGTVFEKLSYYGGCPDDGSVNAGVSGVDIVASAQGSYCRDIIANGFGNRIMLGEIPCDNLWLTNARKGPGFTTTSGPSIRHGFLSIEHINQSGLFTMLLKDGVTSVPRPACYFKDARGLTIAMLNGEGSVREVVIDACQNVIIGRLSFNGPGASAINGHAPTMISMHGDTYELEFGTADIQGAYDVYYEDQSLLAIADSDNGEMPDGYAPRRITRNAALKRPGNLILPGPYADDATAATFGVPVGAAYRKSDGTILARTT